MPYIGSSRYKYSPYLTIHFGKTEKFVAGDAVGPWEPPEEGSGSDAFFGNNIFLWHAEAYTDSSPDNRILSIQWTGGGSYLSNNEKKFGQTSSYHAGGPNTSASGYMIIVTPNPNFAEFPVRTPFTMEGWIFANAFPSSVGQKMTAFGFHHADALFTDYTGLTLDINNSGHILMSYSNTFWNRTYTSSAKVSTGLWTHLALVREQSNTTTLYINGTETGPKITGEDARIIGNFGRLVVGGQRITGVMRINIWNGYLDEIRFTKNTARYIANFTPPQFPFPNQG